MRFVRFWSKVERKYIQERQPNQFYCYNQIMGFVNRMDQKVAKYGIDIRMKKWWWFPFVWMIHIVLQGQWKRWVSAFSSISKRCCQCNFYLKYSKEGRLSSNHVGIRNISSDVCYDGTEHYQAQSVKSVQKELSTLLGKILNISMNLANVWLCNERFENLWINSV